jgi:hypothetical protein
MKIWSWAQNGCLTPRQTDQLAVNHKIMLFLWLCFQALEKVKTPEDMEGTIHSLASKG